MRAIDGRVECGYNDGNVKSKEIHAMQYDFTTVIDRRGKDALAGGIHRFRRLGSQSCRAEGRL